MSVSALHDAQTSDELFALLDAGKLFHLDGLVAVITGGASGIGLAITTTLLANGAVVHVVDRSKEDLVQINAIYGAKAEGRLFMHEGDVSLKNEATRIAEIVAASTPYINVLFNNAGISGPAIDVPKGSTDPKDFVAAMNQYDENSFNSVFAVNTIGPYFFAVAFLPLLCASKESAGKRFAPQIVNTCSLNAWSKIRVSPPKFVSLSSIPTVHDLATSWGRLPYQLSKGAIHQLTKILAHELAPLHIRVNGFAPGLFVTGMTSRADRTSLGFSNEPAVQFDGESTVQYGPDFKIPVQELGRFEDLSGLALMLITNRYINGEVVLIDGGSLLRHPAY